MVMSFVLNTYANFKKYRILKNFPTDHLAVFKLGKIGGLSYFPEIKRKKYFICLPRQNLKQLKKPSVG
jgi:hypothetical protein